METIAAHIASLVTARDNCIASGNTEWKLRHERLLTALATEYLPSGSGWDLGTTIDLDRSSEDCLIFQGQYHHMNSDGFYDGWTRHEIWVRPRFEGFNIRITGRNRADIKEYLHELFDVALRQALDLSLYEQEPRK
jgi:hypothetical protein